MLLLLSALLYSLRTGVLAYLSVPGHGAVHAYCSATDVFCGVKRCLKSLCMSHVWAGVAACVCACYWCTTQMTALPHTGIVICQVQVVHCVLVLTYTVRVNEGHWTGHEHVLLMECKLEIRLLNPNKCSAYLPGTLYAAKQRQTQPHAGRQVTRLCKPQQA